MNLVDQLGHLRLFILYRLETREDGKLDKIPTNPLTGENSNAQDPATWMTGPEATLWATQWGDRYGPGVMITETPVADDRRLFFLDLDSCRDVNGGWQPHVLNFLNRFPAAYAETSVSGRGLHIFGTYKGTLIHSVKNKPYHAELYTRARFAACGTDGHGLVLTDCTDPLTAFAAEFFPERPEAEHGVEWTTGPVDAWRGPTDDARLIERAIRSASPRAVFGNGAAFEALWRADADVLAKVFPPFSSNAPWDRSSADQALANHLAFWTGNDCERMQRIMWQSGLVRDKWHRPDYLPRTILEACGTQREWYTEPAVPPFAADSVAPDLNAVLVLPAASPPPDEPPPVGEYCNVSMMRQIFTGYCYVQDIHAIQLPDGSALTKDRFDATFGGPKYAMTTDGQKPTKSAWEAYVLSEIHRFPRVETQYFKPGEATGAIRTREGRREINSYRPADVRRVVGDPAPFLDLVQRMLPKGDDSKILLCYLAACVQHLGIKFKWAPFIQGTKGNGKTTVGQVLEYCMSFRYTHWAKADQIGEKFNSVFVDKLFVIVDEMYSDDARELQEILKLLVTATRIEVRPMHGEKTMKEICFNMLLFSNHQNGVRIDLDERRYAALFCAQQSKADKIRDGLTKSYFIALHRWLWQEDGAAIVYDYLMSMQIPDELNPATHCIEAPVTTSTDLAATSSLGGVEQEIIEAIKQQHDGFRNGWVSSQAVDFLLARVGKDKIIPRTARKGLVMSLGYIPHPSLPEGICEVPLPDGHRPRLYVERGHTWAVDYLTAQQVRDGFLDAQKPSPR